MTDEKATSSASDALDQAQKDQQNDPEWGFVAVTEEDEVLCNNQYATVEGEGENRSFLTGEYQGDFIYPLDMDRSGMVSSITFEAQHLEGVDLSTKFLDGIRALGQPLDDTPAEDPTNENTNPSSETTADETPAITAEEEAALLLESIKNQSLELPSGTPVGTVSLYLPQSIVFSDGVNYNKAELGILGGIVAATVGGEGGGTQTITDAAGNLRSGYSQAATNLGVRGATLGTGALVGLAGGLLSKSFGSKITSSAAGLLAGGLGAKTIGDGLGSVTRVASNPNVRSLFQSVNLRSFRFAFRLVAQNHEEAEEIKKIITFFRDQLYPESLDIKGIPFGFIFPNIFQLKMYHGRKEIEGAKILPSYLESVQVTYNPSAGGMHSDGNWTDVDIQLGFVECTTLDKNRIREGY